MTHHNISASTLARTAALALALTNQVLSAVGKPILPIESAQLEQLISSGLTVAAALASWWNNNSFTPEVIEADDFMEVPVPKYKRLTPNGPECRLKGAYLITCTGCKKDENGNVVEVYAEYDPNSPGGDPADGRKVKGATIHWVDATLDGGRIIAQRAFAYDGDDVHEVERRVHEVEHELYVETIDKLVKA